ncbi:MAG TPA: hypothetical protein VNM40_03895 [Candidatus Paceibacterota bacterium]|nr:hypothetical protein [Candidatus Paceibacterota bacterium]
MRYSIIAWLMVVVAIALWAGFGGLIWQLGQERATYAEALESAKQESIRGESAARLRASVQSTEVERAALESVVAISILQAVESIEQAGRAAGVSNITIGGAAPAPSTGGLSAVSIVVNGSGSFGSLMRAVSLFEVLPLPTALDHFELEQRENTWHLTARLRVLYSPSQ